MKLKKITTQMFGWSGSKQILLVPALTLTVALLLGAVTWTPAQQHAGFMGKSFTSPEEAAEALIAAAEKFDVGEMQSILGPDSYDLINSGEPAVDRDITTEFATKAREKLVFSRDKRFPGRVFLTVGDNSWPFPIPLQKQGTKWFFDTKSGRQEVLYRRVGRNELDAIQVCRGYVEAQNNYALTKHDGSQVNQYAQRIISSTGKQDGLAWQNSDGSWDGAVSQKAALAIEKSYTGQAAPFHGYYFKILKGQGLAAPLGRLDYVINGAMIGGFALLAYPAQYQVTGVKSFIVSQDGVVYEKDLGTGTLDVARTIELFNPDTSWRPVLKDEQ